MTTQRSPIVPALLFAGVATAIFWWWRDGRTDAPSAAPAAEVPAAPAPSPAAGPLPPMAVTVPPPAADPQAATDTRPPTDMPFGGQVQAERSDKPGVMTYPDGSTRPALNGVASNVAVLWDPDRPYSPIVDKIVDREWEFYRHADGTLTTVMIVPVNGVPQVCPYTAHPNPTALPVLGSDTAKPPTGPQPPAK